jgi:hypothetical protein
MFVLRLRWWLRDVGYLQKPVTPWLRYMVSHGCEILDLDPYLRDHETAGKPVPMHNPSP